MIPVNLPSNLDFESAVTLIVEHQIQHNECFSVGEVARFLRIAYPKIDFRYSDLKNLIVRIGSYFGWDSFYSTNHYCLFGPDLDTINKYLKNVDPEVVIPRRIPDFTKYSKGQLLEIMVQIDHVLENNSYIE